MRVLLFADGSEKIGTGHIMRTLVLASELTRIGIEASIAGRGAENVGNWVRSFEGVYRYELSELQTSEERLELLDSLSPDLVILDGYHFEKELFEHIEKELIPYGIIDDNRESSANAPLFVLNQNPYAKNSMYARLYPNARLFLGLEYLLLRREIREHLTTAERPPHASPQFVMIALGGSDPKRLTLKLARVFSESGLVAKVALGPMVADREVIIEDLGSLPNVSIVSPREYESALASSSMAILGAGTSIWEAVYLGIPTVALELAENQRLAGSAIADLENITFFPEPEAHDMPVKILEIVTNNLKSRNLPKVKDSVEAGTSVKVSDISSGMTRLIDYINSI